MDFKIFMESRSPSILVVRWILCRKTVIHDIDVGFDLVDLLADQMLAVSVR